MIIALLVIWAVWLYLVVDTLWKGPRDRGSVFLISGWTAFAILGTVLAVAPA